MFRNDNVNIRAAQLSIVAFFSTIVSTVIGTLLAIALERYRFRDGARWMGWPICRSSSPTSPWR